MGRSPNGKRTMSASERQRRRRERQKVQPTDKRAPEPAPDTFAEWREDWWLGVVRKLKRENAALRKEVAALLPLGAVERYRRFCRKAKAAERARWKGDVAAMKQRLADERVRAHTVKGAIPDELWRAVWMCVHPDGNPSMAVRTRAANGLREREKVLRAREVRFS